LYPECCAHEFTCNQIFRNSRWLHKWCTSAYNRSTLNTFRLANYSCCLLQSHYHSGGNKCRPMHWYNTSIILHSYVFIRYHTTITTTFFDLLSLSTRKYYIKSSWKKSRNCHPFLVSSYFFQYISCFTSSQM
jgi:hypothetical protein